MKNLILIIGVAFLSFSIFAQEKTQVKIYCDKNESVIRYSMKHPLHAWTAESKEITSLILSDENRSEIRQVAVSVKIISFDSKNANRDSHTIEVTEALKYPNVSFASTSIVQEGNKLIVKGTLNFHGIGKEISFEADKKIVHKKAEITGSFIVNMLDFKIEPPSLMGIPTDENIVIDFKILY